MEPRLYIIDSPLQQQRVVSIISRMRADPDHPFEVIVRDTKKHKTGDQRKLFHAIVSEIGLEVGEPAARIKTAIKADFYGVDSFVIRGHTYLGIQSTEESDRAEYSRLIDYAILWAAERGIIIQDRRKID